MSGEIEGRGWRWAFALAAVAVLAVSALEAAALYRYYLGKARLPLWDMAGHGWGGVELLRALAGGKPLHFLDLLNRQDKWPFGYSLLLLPFLAAGGASFASATLLSTVLFALVPLLLLWAAREVDPGPAGLWGGLLAAALFLASPLPRVFAILIMRETAGIFFTLLALVLYLRARRLDTSWSWRCAGLAALALFLVKYNYALAWGLAVLANELWRLPPDRRRELGRRSLLLVRPWGQPSGWRILLAVFLDLLILSLLLGINPGVGFYAGLVVGTALLALRWRRDPAAFRARWRALPTAVRAGLATFVVPLWIWCLSPDPIHPKNIVAFLRNRSTGPPLLSVESLGYYFRALLREYAPAPILGVLIVLGLLAALIWLRRADEPLRVLTLTAALGLGLATFHPYKELRFLAVTAPFLMLLAALVLSLAVHGRRPASPRRTAVGGGLGAAALAAIWSLAVQADLGVRLAQDYPLYSSVPALRRPLSLVADRALGARRLALVGTFNELSPNLVRWWLALDKKSRSVTVVEPPSRFPAGLPAVKVRERARAWTERQRPDRILAFRLLAASPFHGGDYQLYNAWQLSLLSTLQADPRWRITAQRPFPALGLQVLVLRNPENPGPARVKRRPRRRAGDEPANPDSGHTVQHAAERRARVAAPGGRERPEGLRGPLSSLLSPAVRLSAEADPARGGGGGGAQRRHARGVERRPGL